MPLVIGLTGGIASGKSTVAKMLIEMGIPVIDADIEAREAVEKGKPAFQEIVAAFGDDILGEDGAIDRLKLGAIIFNDEKKRLLLNSIVHPAVRKSMLEKKDLAIEEGHQIVVLDIPLLYESKLTHMADKVIVVYVDEDIQLKRLMERNNFSNDEAMARIRSQMPLKEKKQLADFVINNNGTLEDTKKQLLQIINA